MEYRVRRAPSGVLARWRHIFDKPILRLAIQFHRPALLGI
jgi:hypothetical protein